MNIIQVPQVPYRTSFNFRRGTICGLILVDFRHRRHTAKSTTLIGSSHLEKDKQYVDYLFSQSNVELKLISKPIYHYKYSICVPQKSVLWKSIGHWTQIAHAAILKLIKHGGNDISGFWEKKKTYHGNFPCHRWAKGIDAHTQCTCL